MKLKTALKSGLLGLLMGLALYGAFFGKKGIFHHHKLIQEIATEKEAIALILQENARLNTLITEVGQGTFPHEKIAREDLQMSCTNEYIYLLKEQDPRKIL